MSAAGSDRNPEQDEAEPQQQYAEARDDMAAAATITTPSDLPRGSNTLGPTTSEQQQQQLQPQPQPRPHISKDGSPSTKASAFRLPPGETLISGARARSRPHPFPLFDLAAYSHADGRSCCYGADYTCALMKGGLVQGRMYVTQTSVLFHALFGTTSVNIAIRDIAECHRRNTAILFPNAIEIITVTGDKFFFASFLTRDHAHNTICALITAQNAHADVGSSGSGSGGGSGSGSSSGGGGPASPTIVDEQPPSFFNASAADLPLVPTEASDLRPASAPVSTAPTPPLQPTTSPPIQLPAMAPTLPPPPVPPVATTPSSSAAATTMATSTPTPTPRKSIFASPFSSISRAASMVMGGITSQQQQQQVSTSTKSQPQPTMPAATATANPPMQMQTQTVPPLPAIPGVEITSQQPPVAAVPAESQPLAQPSETEALTSQRKANSATTLPQPLPSHRRQASMVDDQLHIASSSSSASASSIPSPATALASAPATFGTPLESQPLPEPVPLPVECLGLPNSGMPMPAPLCPHISDELLHETPYMTIEMPVDVAQFYRLILAETSPFWRENYVATGYSDVTSTPWTPTEGCTCHERTWSFTMILSHKLTGRKPSRVRDVQTCAMLPNGTLLFRSITYTGKEVPYSDCFHAETLLRVDSAPAGCVVSCCVRMVFTKSVIFRALIERSALSETQGFFAALLKSAKELTLRSLPQPESMASTDGAESSDAAAAASATAAAAPVVSPVAAEASDVSTATASAAVVGESSTAPSSITALENVASWRDMFFGLVNLLRRPRFVLQALMVTLFVLGVSLGTTVSLRRQV